MATCGFLAEANKLLACLWRQGIEHDRNIWLLDLSFEVLWHTKGERPAFVPFETIALDTIEKNYRNYIGGDRYAYEMPDVEWQQLTGKDAYRQAQTWFLDVENDKKTLFLLQKALEEWGNLARHEFATATIMAAEIAAKAGNEALAIKMSHWWGEKYPDFYNNYNFPLMAQSRHLAPFLLKSALADTLKLDKITCENLVNASIEAIEKRMSLGRSLFYGHLTWSALLKKLSKLAVKAESTAFTADEVKTKWLGRPKTNLKAIKATEKRLNLQLPDDYKAFLLASNGFSNFASYTFSELLPIEEIGLYKELESLELYNITKNYIDAVLYETNKEATIEPYTERAILVSRPHEQLIWLIPPIFPNTDWEAWRFSASNPGEMRYPSFRHLMEAQVKFFQEL
jgi:SMI1 / KNR4 family (SUKH-1)